MNTDALVCKERLAPLGIRYVRLWRRKFTFGGEWAHVYPISLLKAQQLGQAWLSAASNANATPAELAERFRTAPVEIMRALVPLLVREPVNPRHLAKANERQIADVAVGFAEVNDLAALFGGFARLAAAGLTIGDLAVRLGQAFHLWPREILQQPAQAVFAIAEELNLFTPRAPQQAPAGDPLVREPKGETVQ